MGNLYAWWDQFSHQIRPISTHNRALLDSVKIPKAVMSLVVEAKWGAGCTDASKVVIEWITLTELGHPQPHTTIITNNTMVERVINHTTKPWWTCMARAQGPWIAAEVWIQMEAREHQLCHLHNQTLLCSTSQRNVGDLFHTPPQILCTQEASGNISIGQILSKGVYKTLDRKGHAMEFRDLEVRAWWSEREESCAWLTTTSSQHILAFLSSHVGFMIIFFHMHLA